ncbi:hypothetical protein B0H13DRAFT_2553278 [Mycena leptocephala]|nr:hypothetical protein B0H13DRAFT_2553278 [Mycena leptocephala]
MEPPSPVEASARASDDVLFTPRTERVFKTQQAQLKRRKTLELQKRQTVHQMTAQTEAEATRAAEVEREKLAQIALEKEKLLREQFFDKVLDDMSDAKYTLAEFLDYIFNPAIKLKADWRWRGFFSTSMQLAELRFTSGRRAWSQLPHLPSSGYHQLRILSKAKKSSRTYRNSSGMAPIVFRVLDAFSTTQRQRRQNTAAGLRRKELLRGSAALSLLKGFSQYNNFVQSIHSAYLAATGAPRQHFAVFGALGAALGYTTVISKGVKAEVASETVSSQDPAVLEPDAAVSNDTDVEPAETLHPMPAVLTLALGRGGLQ